LLLNSFLFGLKYSILSFNLLLGSFSEAPELTLQGNARRYHRLSWRDLNPHPLFKEAERTLANRLERNIKSKQTLLSKPADSKKKSVCVWVGGGASRRQKFMRSKW
jgi:hypothetical protein